MIQRSYDKIISFRIFLVFAIVVIALLAAIATDGARRGMTSAFPNLSVNFESLAVAISELDYGTTGIVGLQDVDDMLKKAGMIPNIDGNPLLHKLTQNPVAFDALLAKAAHLQHIDRTKIMIIHEMETGMADYYELAMILFGHHVDGFYWLWFGIICFVSLCFLSIFWRRPVLIFPAIIYLVALFLSTHHIDPNYLQLASPTNDRFFPFTSFYLILFILVLAASAPAWKWIEVFSATVCGLLYVMLVNARSDALWQFGAPIGVLIAAVLVRIFPVLQLAWGGRTLSRYALWPLVVFSLATGAGIAIHHLRQNHTAYAQTTFLGHPFWPIILYAEAETYPRLELTKILKEAGIAKYKNEDDFVNALSDLEIKKLHEKFSDYSINGMWIGSKWDRLCRQIVFDQWREHPLVMLSAYENAFSILGYEFRTFFLTWGMALLMIPSAFLGWLASCSKVESLGPLIPALMIFAPLGGVATLLAPVVESFHHYYANSDYILPPLVLLVIITSLAFNFLARHQNLWIPTRGSGGAPSE